MIAANTGNPREFAGVVDADVSPVEYSRTLPASILMVVEKSRYPSFVIFRVWVPADNPEIIVGLIPLVSLSRETTAPAGVVVTDSDPVESDDETTDPELVGCTWTCWIVTGAFVGMLSVWDAGGGFTTGWVVVGKGTRSAEITYVCPG
jgi:hypothetical protein